MVTLTGHRRFAGMDRHQPGFAPIRSSTTTVRALGSAALFGALPNGTSTIPVVVETLTALAAENKRS
jgi:hypothetical protein